MRFIISTLFLVLCACSNNTQYVKKDFDSSNYTKLYKTLYTNANKSSNETLLMQMQLGYTTFGVFRPSFAIFDLDTAERKFNQNQQSGLLSGIFSNVGATFSNDRAIAYRGYIYEGTLLNLYKAMAYSSIDDDVSARVEFNRANDRQRSAKDYYQKEIAKANKKAIESANQRDNAHYENNVKDYDIESILNEKYSNLKNFAIYKDLINPSVSYISGIFFMIDRDYAKSVDLLKEAYGISNARIIAEDMQILQERIEYQDYPKFTWVIIEDGNIARKNGIVISQPVFINRINFINLALPILENGNPRFNSYQVNNDYAYKIVSLSQIFASEFEKQLPTIITRAIISAIAKFVSTQIIDSSVSKLSGNDSIGLLSGAISALTFKALTSVDDRSSVVLPDSVWIARVENTSDNVAVYGNGRLLTKMTFSDECNSMNNRKKDFESFRKIVKDGKLSDRISFFKKNVYENVLCRKTDNIIYVRVLKNMATNFIIKGD